MRRADRFPKITWLPSIIIQLLQQLSDREDCRAKKIKFKDADDAVMVEAAAVTSAELIRHSHSPAMVGFTDISMRRSTDCNQLNGRLYPPTTGKVCRNMRKLWHTAKIKHAAFVCPLGPSKELSRTETASSPASHALTSRTRGTSHRPGQSILQQACTLQLFRFPQIAYLHSGCPALRLLR